MSAILYPDSGYEIAMPYSFDQRIEIHVVQIVKTWEEFLKILFFSYLYTTSLICIICRQS